MKLTCLLPTAATILAFAFLGHVTNAGEAPDKAPQVVVLKLDDVVAYP